MDFCHTIGGLLVGSSETHFSLVGSREKLRGYLQFEKPPGKTLIGPVSFNYPSLDQSLCQGGGAQ